MDHGGDRHPCPVQSDNRSAGRNPNPALGRLDWYEMLKILACTLLLISTLASVAIGESFRVATYNIHYDNFDSDQLIAAVVAADADVICFQEASDRTMDVIRDRLANRLPHISRAGQYGFASRNPPANVTLDRSERFRAATFDCGGRSIRVVNTHLTPIALPKKPNLVQVMGALANSDQAHMAEVDNLLSNVNLNSPTVILGDFNALSQAKVIRKLRSLRLIDSLASIVPAADRQFTWDWQTMLKIEARKYNRGSLGVINSGESLDVGLRIDYIFHTDHFKTTDSKVIRRDGSDHFLVVSELAWKKD